MKPSSYAPATARNAELSVREVTASYGELVLVEQAAISLLAGLGWTVKNLYGEPLVSRAPRAG